MILSNYIRRNWPYVKMRLSLVQPKSAKHDWRGNYVSSPRLWERGENLRMYIPLSQMLTAGYIDLHRQTIHPEVKFNNKVKQAPMKSESLIIDAAEVLRKALTELQKLASLEEGK